MRPRTRASLFALALIAFAAAPSGLRADAQDEATAASSVTVAPEVHLFDFSLRAPDPDAVVAVWAIVAPPTATTPGRVVILYAIATKNPGTTMSHGHRSRIEPSVRATYAEIFEFEKRPQGYDVLLMPPGRSARA